MISERTTLVLVSTMVLDSASSSISLIDIFASSTRELVHSNRLQSIQILTVTRRTAVHAARASSHDRFRKSRHPASPSRSLLSHFISQIRSPSRKGKHINGQIIEETASRFARVDASADGAKGGCTKAALKFRIEHSLAGAGAGQTPPRGTLDMVEERHTMA